MALNRDVGDVDGEAKSGIHRLFHVATASHGVTGIHRLDQQVVGGGNGEKIVGRARP